MKFTFAFVLIALFAVIAVCQADKENANTSDNARAKDGFKLELTKEEIDIIRKIFSGRRYTANNWMNPHYG
uniref:Uncharacterized protein n=1 Tax=Anopheles stephensi TaxID=30069 RepID=A0A182Y7Z4_ANOST